MKANELPFLPAVTMAAASPPRCSSFPLAAFTIASTLCLVMSPTNTLTIGPPDILPVYRIREDAFGPYDCSF